MALLTAWLGFATTSSFGQAVSIESVLDTTGSPAFIGDPVNNAARINCVAGCAAGGGGTSSTFGAAFPALGTAAGFSDGVNMQAARLFDVDSGAGTQYALGNTPRCLASGGSTPCFPPTFLSTASIPAQTATFFHGGNLLWDGSFWFPALGDISFGARVFLDTSSTNPVLATQGGGGPAAFSWATRLTNSGASAFITTTGDRLHVDGSGVTQPVNLAQIAGIAIINGGLAGSQSVGGTAGNNAAITQNPLLAGCEAITYGTQPTTATTGNQRRVLCTTEGALDVTPGHNRFSCFIQAVTVTTQCQAAPGAGLRNYVLSLALSNQAATVQSPDIVFGTGANCATGITALTHKWTMGTLATTTNSFAVNHTFYSPLVPTAANAICVRPSAATVFGATITGYIAP